MPMTCFIDVANTIVGVKVGHFFIFLV